MKKLTLRKISAIKANALLPGINLRRMAMKPLRQSAGIGAHQPPSMVEILTRQPPGDLSTRKEYRERKVDTEPTINAYRGIVNIYELLERPTPGVARRARKRKGIVREEEIEAPVAAPTPVAVPQKRVSTKKGVKRERPTLPEGSSATPRNAAEILTWMRRNFPGRVRPTLVSDEEFKRKYKPISAPEALSTVKDRMIWYRKGARGAIEFAVMG